MEGIVFNAQRPPSPIAEKTLDGSTSSPSGTLVPPKVSFRDMVLGDRRVPPPMSRTDLIAQKLMSVSLEDGGRLNPKIKLDPKVFNDLCEPWRDVLIITLLGKTIAYKVMKERLQKL